MSKKKETVLGSILVTQQFDIDYWKNGWDKETIESEDIKKILAEINERANQVATVVEAYAIKHDKDFTEFFDIETQSTLTKPVEPHIHALLKFSKGATLLELATHIGIEPQYLEKARSGRYGYDNLLAYLIHAKDSDKHQYNPDEVITLLGKDYQEVYQERQKSWLQGRAKKEVQKTQEDIDLLLDDILNERITKQELLLNSSYHLLYVVHKTRINEAFRAIGEIKGTRTKQDLENGLFKKTILFVYGKSGLGKTRLAKELVSLLEQLANVNGQKWQSVLTAGTNIFDEVNGEEILLLDDVRGDSLTASDWLKILDPYSISPISARYQNRIGSAKVIIITSTKHPLEFFYHTKGNDREDLSQYVRRFDFLISLESEWENLVYFESSPTKVYQRRRKIPKTDIDVYLSYDFSTNARLANKSYLLELLLAKIGLDNQWENWDYKLKTPSDTLASDTDEAEHSTEEK